MIWFLVSSTSLCTWIKIPCIRITKVPGEYCPETSRIRSNSVEYEPSGSCPPSAVIALIDRLSLAHQCLWAFSVFTCNFALRVPRSVWLEAILIPFLKFTIRNSDWDRVDHSIGKLRPKRAKGNLREKRPSPTPPLKAPAKESQLSRRPRKWHRILPRLIPQMEASRHGLWYLKDGAVYLRVWDESTASASFKLTTRTLN